MPQDDNNAKQHESMADSIAKFKADPEHYFHLLEITAYERPELLDAMREGLAEYADTFKQEFGTLDDGSIAFPNAELRAEYKLALQMQLDCLRAKAGLFGPRSYTKPQLESIRKSDVESFVVDVRDVYRGEFENSLNTVSPIDAAILDRIIGYERGHADLGGPALQYYSENGLLNEHISESQNADSATPPLYIWENTLPNSPWPLDTIDTDRQDKKQNEG
jgi:hypothetical protein